MERRPPRGRRVWVYLDRHRNVPCAVWTSHGPHGRAVLTRTLRAFDMSCYRRLHNGMTEREAERGRRVAQFVTGNVVYAFYCRGSHSIKIGRTTDIQKRWAQLENQSGQLRQLIAVWKCPDPRMLEHDLHRRWLEHRTIGEWFAADPVLIDLRQIYAESKAVA